MQILISIRNNGQAAKTPCYCENSGSSAQSGAWSRDSSIDARRTKFAIGFSQTNAGRPMRAPVCPPSCPTDCPVLEEKIQESSDSPQVRFCWEAIIDGDLMPLDLFFENKPKWSIQMSCARFRSFSFAFASIRETQLESMDTEQICHISSKSRPRYNRSHLHKGERRHQRSDLIIASGLEFNLSIVKRNGARTIRTFKLAISQNIEAQRSVFHTLTSTIVFISSNLAAARHDFPMSSDSTTTIHAPSRDSGLWR
jgi:hypothetical protein